MFHLKKAKKNMRLLSILVAVFASKWPTKKTNRTFNIHLRNNLMVDKEDEPKGEDDPECKVEMFQGDTKTNFGHFFNKRSLLLYY